MSDKKTPAEEEYFAREEAEKLHRLHQEKLKAQDKAAAEAEKKLHWMKCSKCGYGLETVRWRAVDVDKCFRCGAIVLDDGELEATLDDLQKGILSLYAAQATTALAMTLEPVSANASDARAYSKEAAEHARAASEQLTKLMSDTGKLGRAAIEHVSKYKSLEKAAYLLGIALILDTQWAQLGSMKVSYSDEQIATPFKQLPATFLKEISAASDPPVVWFCTAARKELAPCTKL